MHVGVFVFIFACIFKCVCNIKLYFVSNLLQSVLFYTTSTPLSSDIPVYFCIILCHCGHIWKRISKHPNNIHMYISFRIYIFLRLFKHATLLWHYKWHRRHTLYFLHQSHIQTQFFWIHSDNQTTFYIYVQFFFCFFFKISIQFLLYRHI